ncbi:alpha/beta hydrolase family protein [Variibacter gotjawalensis]|uniref:Alpha/beta hydrolase family protein n=1 Tax=Variibacter gotjawalensis TaxID=1333996 RepID=A0A0S3PZK9_9BRAD|nr:alpha/beta hydrolase [Variibacter gotjawalensis]NIK47205.1 hypothetical protein [Variibacter gotjawalensis]RZS49105.1 alpha/beta hydrolase family protein [Variibacter gotjawalensis]BAT61367.1 alpha/beta hydrolase family protein [Variibacter gotjawalensis]
MSAAAAGTIEAPSKLLLLLEGRALPELGAFYCSLPLLSMTARGDGHPVLVLPGLMAGDATTRPLRSFLNSRGYKAHGWNQGRNLGLRPGVEEAMIERIRELRERYGRKVSLVGWSLGGLYARQLAKLLPDDVRLVITLGSPFAGPPKSTNAWRVYEMASGQRAEKAEFRHHAGPMHEPPPVPTTAIYSKTDGVCAWQSCMEKDGPQTESIEVHGSHMGLGHLPAAVYAIADRLAQPEGEWTKFSAGWMSCLYPNPKYS